MTSHHYNLEPIDLQGMIETLQCANANCACRRDGIGAWTVHCPAHDDELPSLAVTDVAGKILVHCHGGCSQEQVIAALVERGL
jgi:hypothetical protein